MTLASGIMEEVITGAHPVILGAIAIFFALTLCGIALLVAASKYGTPPMKAAGAAFREANELMASVAEAQLRQETIIDKQKSEGERQERITARLERLQRMKAEELGLKKDILDS